ncbi:MAG: methyltransferase domain-containing protein [Alphaproteobacteria bacterium]|jgi:NADH dehydrogenase [ubiquinone] 1 alpha subcomplex assembly factor 5|nr:methyltransferase domain-containing protein [Alphaproteobacteria bacterium]MBT5390423.1 methyltransferase domain-containing protein [Alphaproteobacteria bacterium]MBT5540677.1 methyltransferase domain-containing protein [Alphaproteobacteria bacterium]
MSSPLLFDPKALKFHRLRAIGKHHPSENIRLLSRELDTELLDRLQDFNRPFPSVLFLGNPPEKFSDRVRAENHTDSFIHAQFPFQKSSTPSLIGWEESLPFGPQCFDLIISNMNIHWINDLPGALIQIHHSLKPDGIFMGTFFGGETLQELREIFTEAETKICNGVRPRFSPIMEIKGATQLLQRAGFKNPVGDSHSYQLPYKSALQVMKDLRFLGETNTLLTRPKSYSSKKLFTEVEKTFKQSFDHITFEVITLTGWK